MMIRDQERLIAAARAVVKAYETGGGDALKAALEALKQVVADVELER